MLFLGLLCAKKERIITRQLTFAANLVTINKVSAREWRNGRRAGFRHQFQRSEGSTPFSRIKNGPKPMLGVIFYLAEKRGRTARPPAGGKQSARWAVASFRVVAPSVCFGPWAGLASCWPRPQQLLPASAAGGSRRCCKSHPVGMSTGADAVARPQAHAWGHFLSCGEEGSNSTAARRWQAISPAISRRVCQRGLTNTHRISIL